MFKKKDEEQVEEEILSMVEEGQKSGFIQEDEVEMISNILDLDDKVVRDVMTSRNKIFAVDKDEKVEDVLQKCLESGFSRYPVYEDDMIKAGESFLMGVYQLTTTRDVHGSRVKSETLLPFVYALQSHNLLDSQEKIDHIYGLTQTAGLQKVVKYEELTEDVIGEMSDLFVAAISKEKKHQKEELTLQIDNEKQQNVLQTKAYFESRRKSFKNILQENKDKLQLAEMMADEKAIKDATFQINTNTGRLQKLDKDEAERISIIENVPPPSISSKLISILNSATLLQI